MAQMMNNKKLKRQELIGSISIFIESYVFSLIAFFFTYANIGKIIRNWPHIVNIFKTLSSVKIDQVPFISEMIVTVFLAMVNAFIGFLLITRKKPLQKPKGFLEICVPILSTYFWLTYNIIPYIPKNINFYLVPINTLLLFSVIGSFIALSGYVINTIAVFNLRRSFSVLVQVRHIVKHGLYRHVRHPIYLGYTIIAIGLSLINPRLFFWLNSAIGIGLVIFRAKLEERKLATYSQEYKEYMHETPFLLPIKFSKLPKHKS